MPYRPSYVSRQSGTEKISRATIATAPTMALDSRGSCVLRRLLPGGVLADDTPGIVSGVGNKPRSRLLTNPDLSSHAINQFLGIVADPTLEHRLDILDLFNFL